MSFYEGLHQSNFYFPQVMSQWFWFQISQLEGQFDPQSRITGVILKLHGVKQVPTPVHVAEFITVLNFAGLNIIAWSPSLGTNYTLICPIVVLNRKFWYFCHEWSKFFIHLDFKYWVYNDNSYYNNFIGHFFIETMYVTKGTKLKKNVNHGKSYWCECVDLFEIYFYEISIS